MKTLEKIILKLLGKPGRLISSSKGQYLYDNPRNFVLFNANIFVTQTPPRMYETTIKPQKIWYGDIDLTVDLNKLQQTAIETNKNLWLLSEMHGRFENEENPDITKYQVFISALSGTVVLNEDLEKYYEFNNNGILQKKILSPTKKTKPTSQEYKKNDFDPILTLSDLNKFRATGKEDTECPYYKFFLDVAGALNTEPKQLQCSSIYVHPKIDIKLKVLTRTWLKKFHKLDGYKLKKELNWLSFDISPATFNNQPEWAKEMIVYVKKGM